MLLIYSFQQTSNYSKKIVKYHAVEINSLEDGLNRTSSLSNGHESKNWANFARNWPGYKSNLARITGKNISIIGLVLTTKILAGCPKNLIWASFGLLRLSVADYVYDMKFCFRTTDAQCNYFEVKQIWNVWVKHGRQFSCRIVGTILDIKKFFSSNMSKL